MLEHHASENVWAVEIKAPPIPDLRTGKLYPRYPLDGTQGLSGRGDKRKYHGSWIPATGMYGGFLVGVTLT
jgi:hypothetical protein